MAKGEASYLKCTGCTGCIEANINQRITKSNAKGVGDGDKPRLEKKDWMVILEWTMWIQVSWIILAYIGLEIWQRIGEADGLVGDAV